MSDLLSSIINITITRSTLGTKQRGFGTAMLLSSDASFSERIRFYSDIDEVADDFSSTTVTYRMAEAYFGQDIQPELLAIGRAVNKPTQKYSIVPSVANSTVYKLYINGTAVSITSDSSATNDEIVDALVTAINALTGVDTLTATAVGSSGSKVLTLTGNAAGDWNAVEVDDVTKLAITMDCADPGIEADLIAIRLENIEWYYILHPFDSKACAIVIATYAEANKLAYFPLTSDSNNITLAIGSDSTTSLMGQFKTSAYDRSVPAYHPDPSSFLSSAWVGRVAPLPPGSETWANKLLSGPDALDLISTYVTNLDAKNGNYYTLFGGDGCTFTGKSSSGEFFDTIRGTDWIEARMGEDIATALKQADKIPLTDAGISVVQGAVQNVLNEGVKATFLSPDPAPLCTAPKAKDIPASDRANRKLTGVKFGGKIAGAIHKVTIAGNLSV